MDEEIKNNQAEQDGNQAKDTDNKSAQADSEREATVAEWQQALETAVKQRDEYLDMARRAQADFQNFKRRNAQTRTDAYDEGVRDTLTAFLPSIDNLDRAINAAETSQDVKALLDGVKLTRKTTMEAASRMGLSEIEALGCEFNPEKHNAVMRAEEGEPGKVLEVFEKGYEARGRVLRYSTVKVSVAND